MVGAPRLLQALGTDGIFPGLSFFSPGYGPNKDPLRGYALCILLAAGCIAIANLNIVASYLTNFYLVSYGLVNFAAFHASLSRSPGWRPSFKVTLLNFDN